MDTKAIVIAISTKLVQSGFERVIAVALLTHVSVKEKFITLGKGFLFFDLDGDHAINRQEFHKGIESMRVKLAKTDVD